MRSLTLASPHAIIMVGIAGSGKSFFAKKFAETFSAPFLCFDDFLAVAADSTGAAHLYGAMLVEVAKTHQSVVLELDTHTRASRVTLAKELRKLGYKPLFVWVQTDQNTAKHRTVHDNRRTSEHFTTSLKQFSGPHEVEKAVVISGKHTYATQARAVLQRIASERAPQQPTATARRPSLKIQ